MVTRWVFHRVFGIRLGEKSFGSAFTFDHDGRQYLVTARHVVKDIADEGHIAVMHEDRWIDIDVAVVGIGEDVDVAVLACSRLLSPTYPLEPAVGGLTLGQQAYFLGFPYGWDGEGEHLNDGYPLAFVKGGIISAQLYGPHHKIYVDAHVNSGFSGGPLVAKVPESPGEFRVVGVVAGIPRPGSCVDEDQGADVGRGSENTGLMLSYGIQHALALINRNPMGFELPAVQ